MTGTHPAPTPEATTTTAEPGLLLRLTAPLQSWGEPSPFNQRDTATFPTRSGVIGLLSAALGRPRTADIDDLAELSLTVRVDRPGVPTRDLHTVGGGLPARETVTTAEGKKRSGDTTTLLSHRVYLADAAFTVALTVPGDTTATELLDQYAQALRTPQWPPYLGRRSCPPEGPLLLGRTGDALHHLIHMPLAASQPAGKRGVEFLSDRPLNRLPVPDEQTATGSDDGSHPSGQVNDEPVTFHQQHRSYRSRPLYRRGVHLPNTPHSLGTSHLIQLTDYLTRHDLTPPEGSLR
jgi:CRISPR system Cascade subunit CasD